MKMHTPIRNFRRGLITGTSMVLLAGIWSISSHAQTNKKITEKEQSEMADAKRDIEKEYHKMDKLRKPDLEKAINQLEKAQIELQKQDWSKIEAEMQLAKEKIEQAFQEVKKGMDKMELEKAIRQVEESIVQQKAKMKKQIIKAEAQLEKAKSQMGLLNKGLNLLEKDGLIEHNDSIKIDWEGNIMILNGKRQSKEISDRYRPFFKRHVEL